MAKTEWLPFEEAREFAKKLNLNGKVEWGIFAKSGNKPDCIPSAPYGAYKNKGWINWKDFLGKNYRSYGDAKLFAISLNLNGQTAWTNYAKEGKLPKDIPSNVKDFYENEWESWGEFLGTGNVQTGRRKYRSYEDAKLYIQPFNIKSMNDWHNNFVKSEQMPTDIPSNASHVYKKTKEWKGWGDFLGTGNIANQLKEYLPFSDAREYVVNLKLTNQKDWNNFTKSGKLPDNIPAYPDGVYDEWQSWGDWLGTGSVAWIYIEHMPFDKAREIVRGLNFKNITEYNNWWKENKPENIPGSPWGVYKNSGWLGNADWLGVTNAWNKNAILSFLRDLSPCLDVLKSPELLSIMRQKGLEKIAITNNISNSHTNLIQDIISLCNTDKTPEEKEEELNNIISQIEDTDDSDMVIDEIEETGDSLIDDTEEDSDNETEEIVDPFDQLQEYTSVKSLQAVDIAISNNLVSDEETINFLVSNRVNGLWYEVFIENNIDEIKERLSEAELNTYFDTIKQTFLEQYDGALSIELPKEFTGMQDGKKIEPNLMQLLTIYKVINQKRIGNWSGVGAGKTLSAILTSRVTKSHTTVIVGNNNTIDAWKSKIKEAFPDSVIYGVVHEWDNIDASKYNYIVLNYEKFQLPNSNALVTRILDKTDIDFVVLDEIQFVKQRNSSGESRRRELVKKLLVNATERNDNLKVLGMSATPVLNNLREGIGLLELILGEELTELSPRRTIGNALAIHEELVKHGLRYKPVYKTSLQPIYPAIDGMDYIEEIAKAYADDYLLPIEQVLAQIKTPTILQYVQKGTVIYTEYIDEIVEPLKQKIKEAGYTVGVYTGEDKTGMQAFKKQKVDVLIGSSALGTGVDGLQRVSDRLIILSLPWTNAQFEQLVGRLHRQGSNFDKIDVIIPQVICAKEDKLWSYDKERFDVIGYKRTLADCAVDGVIPGHELKPPTQTYKDAKEALAEWIERLENEGFSFVQRLKLQAPIVVDKELKYKRAYSFISNINKKWNNSSSQTTHDRLTKDPKEWYEYHAQRKIAKSKWIENPVEKITEFLEQFPGWHIADFGCGEAYIAKNLKSHVYSFDHVAIDDTVIACDVCDIPYPEESFDAVVICLAMIGRNREDYLKEAYRVIKLAGHLILAEPVEKWKDKDLKGLIESKGFKIYEQSNSLDDRFVYFKAIKI